MRFHAAALMSFALLASLPAAAGDSGAYVGVGVGQAKTRVDDLLGSGYEFNEQDTGFKIFGGYRFFPWLAVEGGYFDGGSPSISDHVADTTASIGIDVQSLLASAVFTLPIGDKFELFIKPGIAYWDSKTTVKYSEPGFSFRDSVDDNGTAFFLGGGAGFNFTENLGMRIEYEWFEVAPEYDDYTDEFVQELDASSGFMSASFVYRF